MMRERVKIGTLSFTRGKTQFVVGRDGYACIVEADPSIYRTTHDDFEGKFLNVWAFLRWIFYIAGALALGVLIGLPAGVQNAEVHAEDVVALASDAPTILYSDRDYRATAGMVPEFAKWDHRPICQRFEQRYGTSGITPKLQRTFYSQVVKAGLDHNELSTVIETSAMHALLQANAEEALVARKRKVSHVSAATLLVHAERAQYFGQDVWCFLCLSTADGKNGTARVMVIGCAPPYGLIHMQEIGTF